MGSNSKLIPLDSMPVGYRFHPNDEELVCYYLDNKILGKELCFDIIPVVDICMFEPWDLPAFSLIESDDKEWFFFCKRDLKYSNGNRANRATKTGYWKITGRDGKIEGRDSNNLIAKKKFLVFYSGRVPNGTKTNWILHEYHSASSFPTEKNYVLCRLILKADKKTGTDSNFQNNNITIDDLIPQVNNHHQTNEEQLFLAETLQPNTNYNFLYSEFEQALVDSSPSNGIHETTHVDGVQQDGVDDMELLDYYEYFNEVPSSNTLLNDMDPEEPLSMVYNLQGVGGGGFSSDTDLEDVQYNRFLGTSNLFNGQGSLSVGREMRMVKESNGNHPSSKHIQYEEEGKVYRRDEIKYGSSSRKDEEYQPGSDDFVSHGSGVRIQHRMKLPRKGTAREMVRHQGKVGMDCSTNAISIPKKEKSPTTESNKDGKIVRGQEVVKSSNSSVTVKGNRVGLESTSLPPLVYLFNVVVGLFLLVVTVCIAGGCRRI